MELKRVIFLCESLFLLILSWTTFLVLAAAYTNSQAYHPGAKIESSMIVYSGTGHHFEYWSISLVLSFVTAVFGVFGLGVEIRESDWRLSDFIKDEIIDDENDLDWHLVFSDPCCLDFFDVLKMRVI